MRAKMISCAELLEEYSDYRDGLLERTREAVIAAHLERCAACASYHDVLVRGVGELRRAPCLAPSDDFLPRLHHRILHLEDETLGAGGRDRTPVALVALLALGIGAAAWVPMVGREPALVELPPVAATLPPPAPRLPTLLDPGAHLAPAPPSAHAADRARDFLLRYATVGSAPVVEASTASLVGR